MFKAIFEFIYNLFPYNIPNNSNVYITLNGQKKKLKRKIKGLNLIIKGSNHNVELELPISFKNTTIELTGENGIVSIKKTSKPIVGAYIYVSNWGRCFIDENIQISLPNFEIIVNNNEHLKPHKLCIGKNVLIGKSVVIRTSDGHAIFNNNENLPYNEPEDIIIGDNVWIAQRSVILKGSKIGSNSIIGACSLVNRKFEEEGVIIAGNPAKIVKRNITWVRDTYGIYKNRLNNVYSKPNLPKLILLKKIKNRLLKLKFKFYF